MPQVRRRVAEEAHVRVLWDLENVQLPADEAAAFDVITRLVGWMRRKGLMGPGVDCSITVFHCVEKRTLSAGAGRALARSCIEQAPPPPPQPNAASFYWPTVKPGVWN